METLWITWQHSLRSRSLARALNIPISEYVHLSNFFTRHALSTLWTCYVLLRRRPRTIFIHYSVMLLLMVLCYKTIRWRSVQVICDCHTKALRRELTNGFARLFNSIRRRSLRACDLCLVSNQELIPDLRKLGARYFVLPDPVPEPEYENAHPTRVTHYCVYSNSYDTDEPYKEVIEASERLSGQMAVFCTGRIPKSLGYLKKQPYKNIYFTDYLEDKAYYTLIANAQCILALTYDEATLLCAGYEALAVKVPLITSDTRVLRDYFKDSVLFTKNTGADIARHLSECVGQRSRMQSKMTVLAQCKRIEQSSQVSLLTKTIALPVTSRECEPAGHSARLTTPTA